MLNSSLGADGEALEIILNPEDPPVFNIHRDTATSPVLIICDHANHAFPSRWHHFGLADDILEEHVAYDIGALDVSMRLSARFDSTLVYTSYSRLIIDPNRHLDAPSSIPEISDGIVVNANRRVGEQERNQRAEIFFWPYHHAITDQLNKIRHRGQEPLVLSIHSFTPEMAGFRRPWHIGVLWNQDGRIATPLIETLSKQRDLCIGDNKPYHARDPVGFTMAYHVEASGIRHVLLEIRQDLIATQQQAVKWADLLYDALRASGC